jgi:hypothetical protein
VGRGEPITVNLFILYEKKTLLCMGVYPTFLVWLAVLVYA